MRMQRTPTDALSGLITKLIDSLEPDDIIPIIESLLAGQGGETPAAKAEAVPKDDIPPASDKKAEDGD